MNKKKLLILSLVLFFIFIASSSNAASLADRLAGYILLQVEENGEAWYINTDNHRRYYMKDGEVAYEIMKTLGTGITNKNLTKISIGIEDSFQDGDSDGDGLADKLEEGLGTDINNPDSDGDGYIDGDEVKNNYNPLGPGKMSIDNNLTNELRGKILLQVESRGEAWYINPKDGKRYYMKNGNAAYQIMRFLSLGITNNDLSLIEEDVSTIIPIPCTENWQCDNWSTCVNASQTRNCTDSNNCGTTIQEPQKQQVCEEDIVGTVPSFEIIHESTNSILDTYVYDNIITWQENSSIYYLDLNEKNPIQITNTSGNTSAKIYEKNIVYYNFNESCISLYNIENETTIEIGNNLEKCSNPFIHDDKIVWASYVGGIDQGYDLEGGLWNIHIYDIQSEQIIKNIETSIGPLSWAPKPIIFESKIVWSDRISNKWEVYMYDLDTTQKTQITTGGYTSTQPFVYENKIVYYNSQPTDATGIYMHELNSGTNTRITNDLAQPINPTVMNNENIFWVDKRISYANHDIYYYNLNTNEEYHFADDPNYYEVSPSVYQNKVVYIKNPTSGLGNKQIILVTNP